MFFSKVLLGSFKDLRCFYAITDHFTAQALVSETLCGYEHGETAKAKKVVSYGMLYLTVCFKIRVVITALLSCYLFFLSLILFFAGRID